MKKANREELTALSGAAVWRLVQSVARCIRAGSKTLAQSRVESARCGATPELAGVLDPMVEQRS
ncbi:hypothetical protein CWB66_20660 [Pseudoalteromonas sp. S558]|nr:hypothetical protein CWB66_20660 [Pseudoalteromonas sp. S558]